MESKMARVRGALSKLGHKVIGTESAKRRATQRQQQSGQPGVSQTQAQGIRGSIGGGNIGGLG